MISSMTGFGRCERVTEEARILVELKSVNHRYLDLAVKMPRRFNCFEARIRQIIREYIERGKTDVYIQYEDYTDGTKKLKYNYAVAKEYMEYAAQMAEDFGIPNDIKVSGLMRLEDVLIMEEKSGNDEQLWEVLEPVLREACESFRAARRTEGDALRADLLEKLSRMSAYVEEIESFSPAVVEEYRRRLGEKIRDTLSEASLTADEGRIVTEITIYADKICTDEEMVRLKSHIGAMRQKLQAGGALGRELDFIAQEMNREANTTLSKANHLRIADTAIALKTEIEKIREQVQNIE
ncbi:MAG: YicC/YloC family endoribonuclease [Eubacteriales bacterium]|nr:YicC/YloC family endoribonuclease [Eubacteriales bacterium]